MKLNIYYAAVILPTLVCAVLFREHLNITAASAGAVILTVLSAFLAVYSERERFYPTNMYSIQSLTDDERADLSLCFSRSFMICTPLYLPFALFFGTFVKVVVPIAIFFAGFTGAGVYYRFKYGNDVHARFKREADELEEQKKKEEMGKWK